MKIPEYIPAQDKVTTVETICLGDLALVGVKPELNCKSGIALGTFSPYRYTWVCTMVNGGASTWQSGMLMITANMKQ